MKKLIVLALLATLAGGAYASSVAVPWFVDFAAESSTIPAGSGMFGLQLSSYIYLKNNTEGDPDGDGTAGLQCAIVYTTAGGDDMTPVANTFTIAPNAAIAFRPFRDDDTEAPLGLVPNCLAVDEGRVLTDPLPAGSATVIWPGESADVQGFVITYDGKISGVSSYLLPPGASTP